VGEMPQILFWAVLLVVAIAGAVLALMKREPEAKPKDPSP